MLKRFSLVLMIVALASPLAACRFIAAGAEDIGGYGSCDGCMTKTKLMVRQQGRNFRECESLIDTYIYNYDINDPYRADYVVLDGDRCCP